jgi:predicted ATPase
LPSPLEAKWLSPRSSISGKEPLHRMLETTRCYALEKLRESGEFDAVARRHAEGCQDLLQQAAAE